MASIVTCTRRLEWDAGHRVLRHGGKCRHLHGHRYAAEVTVLAPELNDLGMVVDFSAIKGILGTWIDENWDHNLMLHQDDFLSKLYHREDIGMSSSGYLRMGHLDEDSHESLFTEKKPYIMPSQMNPTAENIAVVLMTKARELLIYPLNVVKIKVWETPNCYAEVISNDPLPTPQSVSKA